MLTACRNHLARAHPLDRLRRIFSPSVGKTPLAFEAAINRNRPLRHLSNRDISTLVGIANRQFQLDRCIDSPATCAPLPVDGGYVFRGLRDTLVRLDAAGERALDAKCEQPRTLMYLEVFQLREKAQRAMKYWEAELTLGHARGDRQRVTLARAWLDNRDADGNTLAEDAVEHLPHMTPSPVSEPATGFSTQALAHMKP